MRKKINIQLSESKIKKFGDGFSIFINGRWVIDASCFTDDLEIRIDNYRMRKIKETKGKLGQAVYKFDKRKTK